MHVPVLRRLKPRIRPGLYQEQHWRRLTVRSQPQSKPIFQHMLQHMPLGRRENIAPSWCVLRLLHCVRRLYVEAVISHPCWSSFDRIRFAVVRDCDQIDQCLCPNDDVALARDNAAMWSRW